MFRCWIIYTLCLEHIHGEVKSSFSIILQSPPDPRGYPGQCELLQFIPGIVSTAPTITAQRINSSNLPIEWKELMKDSSSEHRVYYITDGMSPDISQLDPKRVRVLEVSSPERSRWKPFTHGIASGVVFTRYMPLVSLFEMQQIRIHVGNGMTDIEVKTRYTILGGSVRGVMLTGATPEDIIADALQGTNSLDNIMATTTSGDIGGAGTASISSTIIHFSVNEEEEVSSLTVLSTTSDPVIMKPFTHYESVFASNYIRRVVLEKFRSRFVTILGEMVNTADLPYTSVLQGNLFEQFAHNQIVGINSNVCSIRRLELPESEFTIDLSGKQCIEFDDVEELKDLELNNFHYYKPISKSFGAVDFMIGKDIVGNMTLNLRHGISITALLRVVYGMRLKDKRSLKFYWLVPSLGIYRRMKKQSLLYKGKVIPELDIEDDLSPTIAQQKLHELSQLVQLEQYVVLMQPMNIHELKEKNDHINQPMEEIEPTTLQVTADSINSHSSSTKPTSSITSISSSRISKKRTHDNSDNTTTMSTDAKKSVTEAKSKKTKISEVK